MIIDEIKKDNVQAMKDKNVLARAIYGVVMNKVLLANIEAKKDGKELADTDVVQILQKTIKELTEERENFNKIDISPKPDSLLRIAIHVKKIDKEQSIKEQKLKPFKRTGFTAVEWGGVSYK